MSQSDRTNPPRQEPPLTEREPASGPRAREALPEIGPSSLLPPEVRPPTPKAGPDVVPVSPSTLLPPARGPRPADPEDRLPEHGPSSLLPPDARLPVRPAGPEVVPHSPDTLLPRGPGARPAEGADEALPAIGPSSLLPETPDARQWREAGPELVAVSPSALLPQAPENRGYPSTPETLPDIGPSSLVPEAERGRSAQPAGPEVVAVSPSELLPPVPPQPTLTRLTVFAAAGVLAVALFFVVAVLIVQRLGPDAQDLLAEADAQIAAGDYPAAILNLREAVRKAPTHTQARLALGSALLHTGDPEAAEQQLRQALDFGLPTHEALVPLARALLLQGKYEELLREVAAAGASATRSPELLTLMGLAHLGADRSYLAREHFTRALEIDPAHPEAQLGMARLALHEGNGAEAMALMDKVLARDPKNIEALVMRAELYQVAGNLDGARAAYESVLSVSPKRLEALVGLAAFDIRARRFDAAESRLQVATNAYPRSAQASYLFGLTQFRRGRLDEARKRIQRALQIRPSHMPSVLLAAAIEYASGNHPEAQRALLWVLHRNPYHLPARRMYGASLLQTGQPVRAIEMLEPILQVVPNNPALLSVLGQAYAQTGNYAKAGEVLDAARRYAERRERATGRHHEFGPYLDQEARLLEETLKLDADQQRQEIQRIVAFFNRGDLERTEQALTDALAHMPNEPRLLNLRAALALTRKDFAAAERDLQRALALDPDYVPAAANMAQIDLVERTPRAARRRIESIHQRDPRNIDALIALARLGPRIEAEPAEIERWLLDAIRIDAKLVAPRIELGRHYLRRSEPAKALEQFNAAKQLRADDPDVLDGLARAHAALGEPSQAQAALTALAMLRPNSAMVLHRLALAQIQSGQKVAAEVLLRKALDLDPKLLDARVTLARLELETGEVAGTLEVARRLQHDYPDSNAGVILEGDVYRYQGKTDAAHAAYAKAWAVSRDRALLSKLKESLLALGRTDEALGLMRSWLGEHPDDHGARKELGNALLLSGRPADATAEYEKLLRAQPNDGEVLNNLAWAGYQLKDPRALEFAERAYALRPSDPDVLDTLGRILAQRNEVERALELQQQAVHRAGHRPDLRYQLAQLYLMTGDRKQARRELKQVVAAGKEFPEHAQAEALLRKLGP